MVHVFSNIANVCDARRQQQQPQERVKGTVNCTGTADGASTQQELSSNSFDDSDNINVLAAPAAIVPLPSTAKCRSQRHLYAAAAAALGNPKKDTQQAMPRFATFSDASQPRELRLQQQSGGSSSSDSGSSSGPGSAFPSSSHYSTRASLSPSSASSPRTRIRRAARTSIVNADAAAQARIASMLGTARQHVSHPLNDRELPLTSLPAKDDNDIGVDRKLETAGIEGDATTRRSQHQHHLQVTSIPNDCAFYSPHHYGPSTPSPCPSAMAADPPTPNLGHILSAFPTPRVASLQRINSGREKELAAEVHDADAPESMSSLSEPSCYDPDDGDKLSDDDGESRGHYRDASAASFHSLAQFSETDDMPSHHSSISNRNSNSDSWTPNHSHNSSRSSYDLVSTSMSSSNDSLAPSSEAAGGPMNVSPTCTLPLLPVPSHPRGLKRLTLTPQLGLHGAQALALANQQKRQQQQEPPVVPPRSPLRRPSQPLLAVSSGCGGVGSVRARSDAHRRNSLPAELLAPAFGNGTVFTPSSLLTGSLQAANHADQASWSIRARSIGPADSLGSIVNSGSNGRSSSHRSSIRYRTSSLTDEPFALARARAGAAANSQPRHATAALAHATTVVPSRARATSLTNACVPSASALASSTGSRPASRASLMPPFASALGHLPPYARSHHDEQVQQQQVQGQLLNRGETVFASNRDSLLGMGNARAGTSTPDLFDWRLREEIGRQRELLEEHKAEIRRLNAAVQRLSGGERLSPSSPSKCSPSLTIASGEREWIADDRSSTQLEREQTDDGDNENRDERSSDRRRSLGEVPICRTSGVFAGHQSIIGRTHARRQISFSEPTTVMRSSTGESDHGESEEQREGEGETESDDDDDDDNVFFAVRTMRRPASALAMTMHTSGATFLQSQQQLADELMRRARSCDKLARLTGESVLASASVSFGMHERSRSTFSVDSSVALDEQLAPAGSAGVQPHWKTTPLWLASLLRGGAQQTVREEKLDDGLSSTSAAGGARSSSRLSRRSSSSRTSHDYQRAIGFRFGRQRSAYDLREQCDLVGVPFASAADDTVFCSPLHLPSSSHRQVPPPLLPLATAHAARTAAASRGAERAPSSLSILATVKNLKDRFKTGGRGRWPSFSISSISETAVNAQRNDRPPLGEGDVARVALTYSKSSGNGRRERVHNSLSKARSVPNLLEAARRPQKSHISADGQQHQQYDPCSADPPPLSASPTTPISLRTRSTSTNSSISHAHSHSRFSISTASTVVTSPPTSPISSLRAPKPPSIFHFQRSRSALGVHRKDRSSTLSVVGEDVFGPVVSGIGSRDVHIPTYSTFGAVGVASTISGGGVFEAPTHSASQPKLGPSPSWKVLAGRR
ncbi:hypothetical protein K437DRAFT_267026 [Tilletiaria anomala UBC 951]|uniref:Uncharacterized protein n=1 Tax=Tilletiaria anomala (strain ATCC 24038 / CBS 436.72 / UBC 951) TaxID=1037660 RepID=A0A066WN08_TILAU|nr:uncharacterized protein K437DRAFT_267026 [Tilletiaria anomala UBC 951]KDN52020.1 hypothetical protein K437DRAFT_267026 [Tilletiaria anomala UBC 951]